MRPEARVKSGFYPAPGNAIDHVLQHVRSPSDGRFAILDPCAGQGEAVKQIADALDCEMRDVYAIEVDSGRADSLRVTVEDDGGNVLGPACYFGCSIPVGTMCFIWCNPPFDDEYGGGSRVERTFLEEATRHLKTKGVMAFVCPRKTSLRSDIRSLFKSWYDNVSVVPFPDECRRYNEVAMLGVKRSKMEGWWNRQDDDVFLEEPMVYQIPKSTGPGSNRFIKIQMTDDELEAALEASPLNEHLKPPSTATLASPPLALGTGHLALLLASGHLDGLVEAPGELPHVVRGTARKAEFVKVDETKEEKGGTMTHKTVVGEKIELIVRAVEYSGDIKTFMQSEVAPTPKLPSTPDLQPTRPVPQRPEPAPVVEPEVAVVAGGRAFDVD